MPSSKLTGVYYGEDVTVQAITENIQPDEVLQFIVQTSTAIADYDDQLTLTDITTFKTKVAGKGLTATTDYIESILTAIGHTQFYVYSIKTNTTTGWEEAITCGSHLKEIKKVIFYEENNITGTGAPTIANKMTAMASACHECSETGGFRIAFVVPQKTVDSAVASASNVAPPTTAVTTLSSTLTNINDGRLCVILPDKAKEISSYMVTKQFYEEIGLGYIPGVNSVTYDFTTDQLVTLRNLGIIIPRPVWEAGVVNYEIELGVTTNYSQDAADGQLVSRTIADELLREIDADIRPFVKTSEEESNIKFVQTAIDGVIGRFVTNKYVTSETKLTVTSAGNRKFAVDGKIYTNKSIEAIEVHTILI